MVWLLFLASSIVVVLAAVKLAEYSDVIAVRTRLGGLVVGTIFLAGATSLPELVAAISSFRAGVPNLAAGNFLGSNMTNIVLLALVDLFNRQVPLLRSVAVSHSLTAALAILLMLTAAISLVLGPTPAIGWVGVDSLLIIAVYFAGIWLMQRENQTAAGAPPAMSPASDFPTLRRGLIGFVIAAAVLIAAVPQLVRASTGIAEITGLGTGFVGTALLSLVTSLPELVAVIAAVRLGSFDLGVGNLLGSNVFNMLGLAVSDFFLRDGPLLNVIDPGFVLVVLLGILLTTLALIGNLARVERRFLFFELDALVIILVYFASLFLLHQRGIGM